jgi:hypothetical protein
MRLGQSQTKFRFGQRLRVLFIIDVYMRPGQKFAQTSLKSFHSLEPNQLSLDRDAIMQDECKHKYVLDLSRLQS